MTRKKSLRELEQEQTNLEYSGKELKVFIADILPIDCRSQEEMDDRLVEVENLVNTYGWVVIVKHIQKKSLPDYNTYIWWGKLDEIMHEMELEWANLLILWNILKPKQIYNINERLKEIWAKARDRVDLILKIFERNALSAESKLQIELAAIKHMWPRIFDMWMELWKQWWKWKWETNTQIMKTHLSRRERAIKSDLEHYSKVRNQHRQSRSRKWISTVWVVGYTNSWKSTLTNSLTKKWVLAEDKLFATLWTNVWKMFVEANYDEKTWKYIKPKEILINDTIWFIRDLPPKLIDAFSSTLEDSIESDILLHVIDASDSKISEKIRIVDDILDNIWANQQKIYVFNKIDSLNDKEIEKLKLEYEEFNPIFISAYKKINLEGLKEWIIDGL